MQDLTTAIHAMCPDHTWVVSAFYKVLSNGEFPRQCDNGSIPRAFFEDLRRSIEHEEARLRNVVRFLETQLEVTRSDLGLLDDMKSFIADNIPRLVTVPKQEEEEKP
jgi:hypothetical protein